MSTKKTTQSFNDSQTNNTNDKSIFNTNPQPDNGDEASSPSTLTGKLISGILKTTELVIGEVLPPTLNLTQKHLLPEILQSFNILYNAKTPPRLKEWLDTVLYAINHLLEVVIATEKGNFFEINLNNQ